MFGGLVFWALCSSRHTAITVTSAISLLVGTSIGDLSHGDQARHVALSMGTAVLVGAFGIAAWAARAGVVVNFVSETVLIGFKCGIAFVLASTQIPKLFGFPGGEGGFWPRLAHIFAHIGETHPVALALGRRRAGCPRRRKNASSRPSPSPLSWSRWASRPRPSSISRRAASTCSASVPQGLPPFGLPALTLADFNGIAADCDGVLPARRGRVVSDRPHVRAQARLSVRRQSRVAGAWRRQPRGGSRSRLSDQRRHVAIAGQRIRRRAHAALEPDRGADPAADHRRVFRTAARPAAARAGGDRAGRRHRPGQSRGDRRDSGTSTGPSSRSRRSRSLGVLGQGILRGVLVGVVLSLLLLLRRASQPNVAELGRVRESNEFASITDDQPRTARAGRVGRRIDGGLLYFNAERARDRLLELVTAQRASVAVSILFLGTVPTVDLAGADMLIELQHALAAPRHRIAVRGPAQPRARCAGSRRTGSGGRPCLPDGRRGPAQRLMSNW